MSDGMSHLDDQGAARMVEIGGKETTRREAVATGDLRMAPATATILFSRQVPKGDAIAAARIAAIQAAKRTSDLIPLCHPIRMTGVDIQIDPLEDGTGARVTVTVRAEDRTGAEMEAMTAVSVALLTLYDMLKSIQKDMVLTEIRLLRKSGGKSGEFVAEKV